LKILEVMNAAIPAPRSEVRETAPKIVSFEIPIDKIGEVIGPKGKVINTIQQETGADISVGDDGMVGTVSIGSKDGEKVEEAKRRIMLILDPPTAELGAIYKGRVVNITKFGAFVNVLPGRDGLVHISKLGGGKRIDRVEDVLSLGMELEVKVDDIDQSGKLSLSLVGDDNGSGGGGGSNGGGGGSSRGSDRGDRPERSSSDRDRAPRDSAPDAGAESGAAPASSFEDFWEDQAKAEFGDLGPAPEGAGAGRPGGGESGAGGARRRRPPRRR
jgi:polyribonucleotide nucleotidyltransferase